MQKIIILFALLITSYFTKAQSNAAMEFVENKGQWNNVVKYKGLANAGEFYLLHQGFKVVEHSASDMEQLQKIMHAETRVTNTSATDRAVANYSPNEHNGGANHNTIIHSHAYEVSFVNASPLSTTQPEKPLSSYNNYFIGNDQSKWANNCKIYTAVTYTNIYPNIDVRYYTNAGTLKYDIIVHPGGDVNQIAMRYDGIDGLKCKHNKLYIKTSLGETQESLPISYTRNNQTFQQQKINCTYKVEGNIVRFSVEDDYDKNATLVIDPTLVFSTLTGSRADNWGYTATYGPDGSFYAGGIVFGNGFPLSNGAYQTTYQGGSNSQEGGSAGYDMGIIKFSANGSNMIYATYIGGSTSSEQPHSLVVDKQGNLIIAGRTASADYPTTLNNIGPCGGFDIVVTKLNATGTGLINSVKIGGTGMDGVNIRPKYIAPDGAQSLRQNYGDDARSEVILDNIGNVYVASCTQSNNFPTTLASAPLGAQDGVLVKLSSNLNTLLFSICLGGSGDDAAYVLAINPTDNRIYVAGGTTSRDLMGARGGSLFPNYQGGTTDGFVMIFNNAGNMLRQSTYIGTGGTDQVYGIQFDKNGFPYIMGTSTGVFPVKNAPYSNAGGKQFIAKLKPDLSDFVYSTTFGSGGSEPNISPVAFLVDRCENVYVSGWGGVVNEEYRSKTNPVSTRGLLTKNVPTGSLLRKDTDGSDLYFFVLQRDATDILHGSFFGRIGGAAEHVDGGTSRFDREGVIYQAVCAACRGTTFPTTPGAWSTTNGSRNCNLAAVKINFELAGVAGEIKTTVNGVANDTIICIGTTVFFEDIIRKAKSYTWDFYDGTMPVNTNDPFIDHIFNSNGRFRVRLIARDSTSCNLTDTTYITIKVGDKNAIPKFTATRQFPCETYSMQFKNISAPFAGTMFSTDTAFGWDFGDGSDFLINGSSTTTFNHRYPGPGTYNVKLVLRDTIFCNVFDTIQQPVIVTPIVKAKFTTPASGCVPYTAAFTNTTVSGNNDYRWDFGDGQQLTQNAFIATTNHTYTLPGTYPIKLVARNSTTCNLIDSFTTNIIVSDTPRSSFTYTPVIPIVNTPHIFNNTYTPILVGDSYLWDFGDGETYSTTDRNTPVTHQYNATATFNACLTVTNSFGCKSTFCLPVQALIRPESDVPNAFTPGRFGVNSILKVDGYGIGPMTFRIFNRWGQKVFETNNRKIGWDGNFNGKPQPMDVYTYTLDILYTDGKTKKTLTGDITLIR